MTAVSKGNCLLACRPFASSVLLYKHGRQRAFSTVQKLYDIMCLVFGQPVVIIIDAGAVRNETTAIDILHYFVAGAWG